LKIVAAFCIGVKLGFFYEGKKTYIFQKEVHWTMLELRGGSAGRAAGLHPLQRF
jgi:hypothetical protein